MKILGAMLISATVLVTGCKKAKDGKDGAQGPQGPAGVVAATTDGFIKGTLTGTRQDNTVFTETYNYTNYWGGQPATLDSTSSGWTFYINRGTSDVLSSDGASISFSIPTLTATSAVITNFNFRYSKSLGTNKEFDYSLYSIPTSSITSLSYNQSTGQLTGNYSINLTAFTNSTNHAGSITGNIQTTVTRIYNRVVKPTEVVTGSKQE